MVKYKRIRYRYVSEDDKVKPCKCGGYFYDSPDLAINLDLTEKELNMIVLGIVKILYCPECGIVEIV